MSILPIIFSLLPLIYLFRQQILNFFIPRSIPGIPAYPDPQPFLGDISRIAKSIKATKSFSNFFDKCAKDLGPLCQVRLSFFETWVD